MLNYEKKEAFNRGVGSAHASKYQLGDILHGSFNVAKGNYKFSRDGGAVGNINLKDLDGVATVKIPASAVVLSAFVHTTTACTSGGSATVDVQIEAANDLLAAEAVASFSLGAKIQGIPDFGTLADSVVTTAERTLSISINTAALTAGEFNVYVFYVF